MQQANNVGTSFWFTEKKMWEQPCLVCTGQATICFSLARFIVRNHGGDVDLYPADIRKIWDQLVVDWKRMNEEPYALLKERVRKCDQENPNDGQTITCIEPRVKKNPLRRKGLVRALQLLAKRTKR